MILTVAVSLLLAAPTVMKAATESQTPDADIRARLLAWDQAYENRDVRALGAILTDDFTLTDASGAVLTRAEYLMSIVKAPDFSRVTSWASRELTVKITGDKAVVTGRSAVKGRPRGKAQAFDGNYVFTDEWVRQAGSWKARRTTARIANTK
jgi:ketosteroid isomerase-like protein